MTIREDNVIFTCVEHILTEYTYGLVGDVEKLDGVIYYEVTPADGNFSLIEEAVDVINKVFDSDYMYVCEVDINHEYMTACVSVILNKE